MPADSFNLTDYNSSLIDIYVEPNNPEINASQLNLTFNVTKFENNMNSFKSSMDIQLFFENTNYISKTVDNYDKLIIYFMKNESELLFSPVLKKYLHENSRKL